MATAFTSELTLTLPLPLTTQITEPSPTLSPTLIAIDSTTPASGDGISILALSPSNVASGVSISTVSPTLTNTAMTSTLLAVPISGTLISLLTLTLPLKLSSVPRDLHQYPISFVPLTTLFYLFFPLQIMHTTLCRQSFLHPPQRNHAMLHACHYDQNHPCLTHNTMHESRDEFDSHLISYNPLQQSRAKYSFQNSAQHNTISVFHWDLSDFHGQPYPYLCVIH